MERIRDYTVIDLEMTGLAAKNNKIIEIGAVRVRGGLKTETYGTLVNPHCNIEPIVSHLTGITDRMLADGMEEDKAVSGLLDFIGDDVIVGHNVSFDYSFIKQWAVNKKIPLELKACDTLKMARGLLPEEQKKKLEALCEYFCIKRVNAHRALDDAIETWQIYEKLADMAQQEGETQLLEPTPLKLNVKRQTPATRRQIEQLKGYIKTYRIAEKIDWKKLTRSEASRTYDRFRKKYGKLPNMPSRSNRRKRHC